jgi:hypothetical protein
MSLGCRRWVTTIGWVGRLLRALNRNCILGNLANNDEKDRNYSNCNTSAPHHAPVPSSRLATAVRRTRWKTGILGMDGLVAIHQMEHKLRPCISSLTG